jgi:hypothetical protein
MRSLRRKFTANGRGNWICGPIVPKNGGVTGDSRVVASVSEYNRNGPFVGSATLSVHGVAPNDNGEIFVEVYVGWDDPIQFRITCFIDP